MNNLLYWQCFDFVHWKWLINNIRVSTSVPLYRLTDIQYNLLWNHTSHMKYPIKLNNIQFRPGRHNFCLISTNHHYVMIYSFIISVFSPDQYFLNTLVAKLFIRISCQKYFDEKVKFRKLSFFELYQWIGIRKRPSKKIFKIHLFDFHNFKRNLIRKEDKMLRWKSWMKGNEKFDKNWSELNTPVS